MLTVAICTYNRAKFIGAALESLRLQRLPTDQFEVLIINNNSTDQTEKICLEFIRQYPELPFRYLVEPQQGLSFARNRAIAEAKGEVLTYIDDDAIAQEDFLEVIHQFFTDHPEAAGMGGRINPIYETAEPRWMNPFLNGFVTKVDHGKQVKLFIGNQYPAGCNMSYRLEILKKAGGFNNHLKWRGDDKYIALAVKEINDQIYYVPAAVVQHFIDAHRITDENFKLLSWRIGNEEGIRVKTIGQSAYLKKVLEYFYKFFGGLVIAAGYFLQARFPQGWYIIKFRYYALKGLFGMKNLSK